MLEKIENQQIVIYVIALLLGSSLGLLQADFAISIAFLISPLLAILLYSMFVQIPFLQLKAIFRERRFFIALIVGNFIIVPVFVWGLVTGFSLATILQLAVYRVLLTPCIDYLIVFTHFGKGKAKLILAATPILFILQMLFLPFYLWLFIGKEMAQFVHSKPFMRLSFY